MNTQRLVQMAGGLFIWASTAVKYLTSVIDPQEGLDALFSLSTDEDSDVRLGKLYARALQEVVNWSNSSDAKKVCDVLGALVVARTPLTDTLMDQLLCSKLGVVVILRRLQCVLQWSPGNPIQVLHTSFTDYLCAKQCEDNPWFIDAPAHHHKLVNACFRIMDGGLRFNICNVETSCRRNWNLNGILENIEHQISPELRYAAHCWGDHFQSASETFRLFDDLKRLMHTKLLFWLEVLSLTKNTSVASSALIKSLKRVQVSFPTLIAQMQY